MKNIFFAALLCVLVNAISAQEKALRKQRILLSHGAGYAFSLNNLHVNPIIDRLTDVNSSGLLFQLISLNLFIKNNIGFEISLNGFPSKNANKRQENFAKELENKFGSRYYVSKGNSYNFQQTSPFDLFTGTFGLCYKIERKRFTYIPKFSIGVVSITQVPSDYNYMKEINGNNEIMVNYIGNRNSNGKLLMSPAATIMYRFNSIAGVSLNLSYCQYKAAISYTETINDLATNQQTITYYINRETMKRLNATISFTIGFGRKHDFVNK
ncbi:MAG: hypothetical protein IT249_09995 [Chitinophagaceae bacterium]|nr:hypothetical protein [Chitinophagaceae bacterium]